MLEDSSHWQELQARAESVKFCMCNSSKLSKTQKPLFFLKQKSNRADDSEGNTAIF